MNRFLSILVVALSFLFVTQRARAQFDVHFNQYWDIKGYYNPAWAGQTDKLNIYGTYSMQLAGFTRAPRTMYFGADMPFTLFNKKQGVGAGFFNDAIGLFRNQRFWLQYSYKMKIKKGTLGIGLQAGIINVSFDPNGVDLGGNSDSDPAFPITQESGTGLDLGIGGFYSHPSFYVGISMQHLTSPALEFSSTENGETSGITIAPMLYFTGGYNIQTRNPLISVQPSLMLQTDFNSARLDLTGRVFYTYQEKRFSAGLTYSPAPPVTLRFGAHITRVPVAYSVEMYNA